MTQVKSKAPAAKKAPKANTLQKQFMALSNDEQIGVTTFFNCHNAAHYVYDKLSQEAQDYIAYCIRLSQQADRIDQRESAQGE